MSYYKESISVKEGGQEFRAWNCESWEDFQEGNCCEREQVVMGEWMDNRWVEMVNGHGVLVCS